eukprot:1133996-Pelagomonas_calceolata.AAC.1
MGEHGRRGGEGQGEGNAIWEAFFVPTEVQHAFALFSLVKSCKSTSAAFPNSTPKRGLLGKACCVIGGKCFEYQQGLLCNCYGGCSFSKVQHLARGAQHHPANCLRVAQAWKICT